MPQTAKDGMIWFSCEGENPADREAIGQIEYFPYPGVPKYFYPYKNQPGYLSPAVFAHFTNPKREFSLKAKSCREPIAKSDLMDDWIGS